MKLPFKGKYAFYTIWFGQLISLFGTAMTRFAVIIWAYEKTNAAMTLGLLGFFGYLPYVIASPFAGVLVDRFDRRKVLLVADTGCGLATLILFFLYANGQLAIWHLFLAEGITAFFEAFQIPAFNASITLLVCKKEYQKANALFSTADNGAKIFAPILGAAVLTNSSLKTILSIDLVTFLAAAITLMFVVIPRPSCEYTGNNLHHSWRSEIKVGFEFIIKNTGLFKLMLIHLGVNFFAAPTYFAILPAMILARSGGNQILLGNVQAMLGIGGLVGGIIMSIWGGPKRKINGYLLSTAASFCLGDFLFAIGQSKIIWLLAAFISAVFIPVLLSTNLAIWQSKVPPSIQGKVFSFRSMGQTAVMPFGFLLGGWLADYLFEPLMQSSSLVKEMLSKIIGSGEGTGMAAMFLLTCVLGVMTSLSGYLSKDVRNIESDLPDFDDIDSQVTAILATD